jgi:hypothetical protein
MPLTSLETAMTKKFLIEDSSSKWEDNKNKSLRIGQVLDTFLGNLEAQTSNTTIKNKDRDRIEERELKTNKAKLKRKLKDNRKSKLLRKQRNNKLPNNNQKNNLKNRENTYPKLKLIKNLNRAMLKNHTPK